MKMMKSAWVAAMPLMAIGAMMIPGAACGEDGLPGSDLMGSLCCDDFNVGADLQGVDFGVDASIAGQFTVFAQASADVAAIAAASLGDVELACRGLATDFGASDEDRAATVAITDQGARVKAWCTLAVASINGSFEAGGKFAAVGELRIDVIPPACSASVEASANCSASCSVSGECDAKATPPTCEGGKMEVSCSGGCKAEGGVSVSCQGGCSGTCEGSCTAKGGVSVACEGKCEGTCEGNAQAGEGIQADGSCKGTCQGTCTASAEAPAVECSGTCNGSCSGECKAEAGGSVKCDGACDADVEPLACKGGELKASCEVDADCDANCSASASAKASCTPPQVTVVASGAANLTGNAAVEWVAALESIKANLSILFRVQAKAEAAAAVVVKVAGNMSAGGVGFLDPGKLGVKGTACLIPMLNAFVTAGDQLKVSGEASLSVITSF